MPEERERNKPGQKIRGFFEIGNVGRDSVNDKIILTHTIHDDMIDRGWMIEKVEADESGHFMTVIFAKRENYVP